MEEKEVGAKELLQAFAEAIVFIGAGAVAGCFCKGLDLSTLKGLGRLCAGVGIIGISHSVGHAAGSVISDEVGVVWDCAEEFIKGFSEEEPKGDNVVEIVNA